MFSKVRSRLLCLDGPTFAPYAEGGDSDFHFPLLFNNQLFQKLQIVLLALGKD